MLVNPSRSKRHAASLATALPILLTLLLAATPAVAAPDLDPAPTALDKVEPALLERLASKDEATFFVLLRERAALAQASAITPRAARTAFVYRQLSETARQSQAGLRELLEELKVDYTPFWIVNAIQVTGGMELLKELATRDDVERITTPRQYRLITPEPGTRQARVQSLEWNIERVRAPAVWDTFGTRGEGIVVASIDSGVDFQHPALVRQYRGNLGNGQFDHNYNWFDPAGVCPEPEPCDNLDHGTHVTGTMVGDDLGGNQIGVAPGARWIAAKGCETRSCTEASLLAAGQWVLAPTDLNGQNPRPDLAPHVVNNSWGGAPGDPFYEGIVDAWVAAGIFPAFAAGNDGPACGTAGSPGDYANAYAVGNHTIDNTISATSSRGPSEFGGEIKPNIAAPGTDVRSSVPGGGYAAFSGTSMATPHVSGTVALMWSAAPALAGDVALTRQLLDDTAIDTENLQCGGDADDNSVWGEGRLDAFAAVQASPRGATGTLTGTVTDAASGEPVEGATVRATGPNDRTVTTGADGTWRLVLSTGTYSVSVSHFGHLTATVTAEVREGETTVLDTPLAAAPSHAVTGHVRDDRGEPLAGAAVTILGTPIPPATTGPDGAYRFDAVPAGEYGVRADAGRCLTPQQQRLAVDGDETLDFALPSRTDAFGHRCRPSAPAFVGATNVLALTGDDQAVAVDLPFPFPFYGETYRRAFVSTNGFLNFLAPSTAFSNTAIPSAAAPNAGVYAFWDDFTVDASASVRTEVVGSAPERRFIVEWRNVRFIGETTRATFELALHENGRIEFLYGTLPATSRGQGDSGTVGIESHTGTDALQYSFGEAVLASGTALTFRRPGAAFAQGTVTDANDREPVAGVTVRALRDGSPVAEATTDQTGSYRFHLPLGEYVVEASAPRYGTVTAPVTLDEEEELVTQNLALPTARAGVSPGAVEVVVPAGETRTRSFTLQNTGGLPLTWQLEERSGGTATDVPWLAATPTSGTAPPGGAQAIQVTVSAAGLAPGVHDAALVVRSNSGRQPELPVAVRLVVPAYQVGVNAGGGLHVDALGDTWLPDRAFTAGSYGYLDNRRSRTTSTKHGIAGTTEDALYRDLRENAFEYRFDAIPNGTYEVDLRFAELDRRVGPNERLFDVIVEGQLLLPAHDVALEVGGFHADQHAVTVRVTDGQLNVRLVTRTGFDQPIINALRVTERPDRQ